MIEAFALAEIPEFTAELKDYYFLKLFEGTNTISYYNLRDCFENFKPLDIKSSRNKIFTNLLILYLIFENI